MTNWKRIKSKRAIDAFAAKWPHTTWSSSVERHKMLSSGDRGTVETFSLNGVPMLKTEIANNRNYSGVFTST